MKMFNKRVSAVFVTTAATAAALLVTAPTANAATYNVDNNCGYKVCGIENAGGQLNVHYNSIANDGYYSGRAHFYGNVYNYAGETVSANGATSQTYNFVFGKNNVGNTAPGTGQAVKNNAASVENCGPYDAYRIYYNSGYQGSSQYFAHTNGSQYCAGGKIVDLNSTLKNNNASQHFA
ncbi:MULTISPECIES: hypothetical protein [unclassified Streptomyces]|uniref:hypothetical protein n=1 Tax=unclassified Streptomyces TaxID=2593676 RepID=UPI0020215936|nr:hypothetical protein [Streptomyces sp. YS415]MCL7427142.1 hypothetical protein [Streptomyces sp. YS415]